MVWGVNRILEMGSGFIWEWWARYHSQLFISWATHFTKSTWRAGCRVGKASITVKPQHEESELGNERKLVWVKLLRKHLWWYIIWWEIIHLSMYVKTSDFSVEGNNYIIYDRLLFIHRNISFLDVCMGLVQVTAVHLEVKNIVCLSVQPGLKD